jgi:hypothetical protein
VLKFKHRGFFSKFEHKNALFKHKSYVKLKLCVTILFVFNDAVLCDAFSFYSYYSMTVIKYFSVFFFLFCQLDMVEFNLN